MSCTRLNKALAHAGYASRRGAEKIIAQKRVTVNGKLVLTPQTIIDWEKDVVAVDGKKVQQEQKVYYLLNKPKGVVCTSAPIRGKRVIDFFDRQARLFTVGRLDKDTTGLIIVTNDGHFANQMIHPSSNIEKEYIAKVDQEVLHEHLIALSKGVVIEGVEIKPYRISKIRKGTLKIVVKEGKKHEVRLLCEQAGLNVKELKRVRIGTLVLGKLEVGSFRPLTEREKKLVVS